MSDGTACGRAESNALWSAAHSITEPTRRDVKRDTDAEWLWELANDPTLTVCDVASYRAATLAYGHIPALWDQAAWSLTTGSEQASGGGASPLRERSPADLDLMETMLTIRETILTQLAGRGLKPRDGVKEQIRQLASHLTSRGPVEHVEWWTFRLNQWARVLTNQLNAADHAPKPVHLRDTACPECATKQVTIVDKATHDRRVYPAILIDFENGLIRCAWCQACGHAWFRGDQLGELANEIDRRQGLTA